MPEIVNVLRFDPNKLRSVINDPNSLDKLLAGRRPAFLTITTLNGEKVTIYSSECKVFSPETKQSEIEAALGVVTRPETTTRVGRTGSLTPDSTTKRCVPDDNGNLVC